MEIARSWNSSQQTRRYTTYDRYGNQSDDAMMRRHNRWHMRFDQPDPYGGSYDLTDPQSLNRYAYVQNDPVNFTDPSGLMWSAMDGWADASAGFWGMGGLMNRVRGLAGEDGEAGFYERPTGLVNIFFDDRDIFASNPLLAERRTAFVSVLEGWDWLWEGYSQRRTATSRMIPPEEIPGTYEYDQAQFNECARTAYRAFRKTYITSSGKAILGGAGLGAGLSAFYGIRGLGIGLKGAAHAAQDTSLTGMGRFLTSGVEMAHGSLLGTVTSAISGQMAVQSVIEARQNEQRLNSALDGCKRSWPGADHSLSFLNF